MGDENKIREAGKEPLKEGMKEADGKEEENESDRGN